MNAIIGMTQLLLDTELTVEQRDLLMSMMSSAEALLQIINDVLDFSKIEAGRLELDPIDFRLRFALGEVLNALAVPAGLKRLELACNVASNVPDTLIGDLGRLRQIVVNLVGNAIKFTTSGEVVVSVDVEELAANEVVLRFTVRDTGIGIRQDKMAQIFRPFEQADGTMTRRFGGTGLGLSISSKLVELMQGRIWVESQPGIGTKFFFTARFHHRKATPLPTSREGRLQGIRVLVIDDSDTQREIVEGMLVDWKARVTAVSTGEAGLTAMERALSEGDPFSVAFVDADLRGNGGFAFVEGMRGQAAYQKTKIIFLAPPGARTDRYQQQNISGLVRKPISASTLLDTLLSSLEDGPRAMRADALVQRAVKVVDAPLRVLLAEDNVVNQKFAVIVLEKMGHRVTVVGDGLEATRLVASKKFDVILMDVQMPEMDGLEATRTIRKAETGSGGYRVPIIAMTAEALKGDRERCLDAGMDAYVTKPFRIEELAMELARITPRPDGEEQEAGASTQRSGRPEGALLRTSPTPPALRGAATRSSAKPPAEAAKNFDVEAALTRAAGEVELLREVVAVMLKDVPPKFERLARAVDTKEFDLVRGLSHTLRGAAGNLGGVRLARALHELEVAAGSKLADRLAPPYAEAAEAWTALEAELVAWRAE